MKYTKEQAKLKVSDSFQNYKKRLAKRMGVRSNSFILKDGFVIFKSKINKNTQNDTRRKSI